MTITDGNGTPSPLLVALSLTMILAGVSGAGRAASNREVSVAMAVAEAANGKRTSITRSTYVMFGVRDKAIYIYLDKIRIGGR